mgnify:CR=1 FL=1
MIRSNKYESNEVINREQTITELKKLARMCKWVSAGIAALIALGVFAVAAIYLLVIKPSFFQGMHLQSIDLKSGEGPCLALVGSDAQSPLMLVAGDGHTAIGSLLMACLAFAIALAFVVFSPVSKRQAGPLNLNASASSVKQGTCSLLVVPS